MYDLKLILSKSHRFCILYRELVISGRIENGHTQRPARAQGREAIREAHRAKMSSQLNVIF